MHPALSLQQHTLLSHVGQGQTSVLMHTSTLSMHYAIWSLVAAVITLAMQTCKVKIAGN